MTASALLAGTYDVRCCATVDEATTLAMQKKPHAVIMDLATIRAAGHRDVRGAIGAIEPRAGAVCVATNAEVIHHVRAMGASGFAGKPYKVEALSSALRLAVAESVAEAASPWVVRAAATREWKGVHNRRLLGQSVAMRRVLDRIALYATHDAPVLILGESGTGKELAAAAIHRGSKRSGQRFLPVNCAAMPESLAESMLFGTLKGAFTDAVESKGVFE
ncbi:MAG: sigma 54-interacting transcriptional regulator, partial [Spirochaetales bacterium]|nr:sigma 54-interacting transcriptional regulator [Spirochaetales bacterium]